MPKYVSMMEAAEGRREQCGDLKTDHLSIERVSILVEKYALRTPTQYKGFIDNLEFKSGHYILPNSKRFYIVWHTKYNGKGDREYYFWAVFEHKKTVAYRVKEIVFRENEINPEARKRQLQEMLDLSDLEEKPIENDSIYCERLQNESEIKSSVKRNSVKQQGKAKTGCMSVFIMISIFVVIIICLMT